ncbi:MULTISPECIES: hypothetical protein [Paenibacillus]|uniref:Uncharacterized protein n=1 Tax=Paenibacillus albilobatus TaxID=2716884 RepID=A0A919XGC8_9BACL|nr:MULTISPECIES: hypothetical protein [Paenibacillus]GIO31666.1 hypothetical protein J2TS6_28070 [Paenibacillus albilobatus]
MKKGFFHDDRKAETHVWIYLKLFAFRLFVMIKPDRPQYRRKLEDIRKKIEESRHLRVNVL